MSRIVHGVTRLKPHVPYPQALKWMKDLSAAKNLKVNPDPRDVLFVVQHKSVYTTGRRGVNPEFIKFDLNNPPCEVHNLERGGDVTYHGPGQLTIYPILHLGNFKKDLHWYVDSLEDVVQSALREWGIEAHGDPDNPGVWVGSEKVGSVGIKMNRWVSTHGVGLNVLPSVLPYFDQIIACGLRDRVPVDIKTLLTRLDRPEAQLSDMELMDLVTHRLLHHFERIFDAQIIVDPSTESEFQVTD